MFLRGVATCKLRTMNEEAFLCPYNEMLVSTEIVREVFGDVMECTELSASQVHNILPQSSGPHLELKIPPD